MQGPCIGSLVCDGGTDGYLLSPILCHLQVLQYKLNTSEQIQT